MNTASRTLRGRQHGLSLMELLVAIGLGMLCIVLIFQVVTLWEGRSRTTASGADAQTSGTLAAFALERDLKLAGMGVGTAASAVAGCTVEAFNDDRATKTFSFPLAPVVITKGASGAPDTIQVLYGNSAYYVADQVFDASSATSKTARSGAGFQLGDLVIVASDTSGDCSLVQVTGRQASNTKVLLHEAGTYANFYNGGAVTPVKFNSASGFSTLYTSGHLFNLGPGPSSNLWSINGTSLRWANQLAFVDGAPAAQEVSEGIINLKAQYGIDGYGGCTADNSIVSSGCGPDGKGEWTSVLPTPMDWSRLRAVRFSVLARSQQYDVNEVTATYPAPSWVDATDTDDVTANGFATNDAGGAAGDWKHYRYRVYEAVVPLRNVIWGTSP